MKPITRALNKKSLSIAFIILSLVFTILFVILALVTSYPFNIKLGFLLIGGGFFVSGVTSLISLIKTIKLGDLLVNQMELKADEKKLLKVLNILFLAFAVLEFVLYVAGFVFIFFVQ